MSIINSNKRKKSNEYLEDKKEIYKHICIDINKDNMNKIKREIDDLKSTININWKVVKEMVNEGIDSKTNKNETEIQKLLRDSTQLIETNITINDSIRKLKEECLNLSEKNNQYNSKLLEEYEKERKININLQDDLTKKKNKLNNLSGELNRFRLKSIFKEECDTILVVQPTQKLTEMHQEMLSTSDNIKKLEEEIEADNIQIKKLAIEYLNLKKEVENIVKKKKE